MAEIAVRTASVLHNKHIAPNVFRLEVEGSFRAKPGQFYMLRSWRHDPLLFRPMSVFDRTEESLSFLCATRGRGTDLLSRLSAGDGLTLLGPLGNSWERIDERIALIGGGTGIAPLYYTAKYFAAKDRSAAIDIYLGFRGRPFLQEEFAQVAQRVYRSSESGEGGEEGLITEIFNPSGYDTCYACGPPAMLAALSKVCQGAGIPLFVSLEERIACGIGACLGCAVRTRKGMKRVCKDGPVFRAEEVFFDG